MTIFDAIKRWRFRSSVTGRFVTKAWALLHKRETVREETK